MAPEMRRRDSASGNPRNDTEQLAAAPGSTNGALRDHHQEPKHGGQPGSFMGGSSFDVLAGGSGTGGFHGLLSNLPSHHDVQMLMANSPRRVGFPPSPHAFSLSGIDSLLQSPSAMPGDFRGFDTPISRAVLDPSSIFTPTPRKHPVSRVAQQLFGPTSGVAGCEGAAGDMSGHPLPPHLQNVPRALQQVHELLSMPGQQSGLQIHKNMQPAAGTNEGGEITDEFEMVRALLSSPTFKQMMPGAGTSAFLPTGAAAAGAGAQGSGDMVSGSADHPATVPRRRVLEYEAHPVPSGAMDGYSYLHHLAGHPLPPVGEPHGDLHLGQLPPMPSSGLPFLAPPNPLDPACGAAGSGSGSGAQLLPDPSPLDLPPLSASALAHHRGATITTATAPTSMPLLPPSAAARRGSRGEAPDSAPLPQYMYGGAAVEAGGVPRFPGSRRASGNGRGSSVSAAASPSEESEDDDSGSGSGMRGGGGVTNTAGGRAGARTRGSSYGAAMQPPLGMSLEAPGGGDLGPPVRSCHCKKSQCLKLYCDCFAAGVYCGMCACVACYNKPEYHKKVMERREAIMARDPEAFTRKITRDVAWQKERHKKGCNCKRSHCLKKYCECYQGGVKCGEQCKCTDCQNMDDAMFTPPPGPPGAAAAISIAAGRAPRASRVMAAAERASQQQQAAMNITQGGVAADETSPAALGGAWGPSPNNPGSASKATSKGPRLSQAARTTTLPPPAAFPPAPGGNTAGCGTSSDAYDAAAWSTPVGKGQPPGKLQLADVHLAAPTLLLGDMGLDALAAGSSTPHTAPYPPALDHEARAELGSGGCGGDTATIVALPLLSGAGPPSGGSVGQVTGGRDGTDASRAAQSMPARTSGAELRSAAAAGNGSGGSSGDATDTCLAQTQQQQQSAGRPRTHSLLDAAHGIAPAPGLSLSCRPPGQLRAGSFNFMPPRPPPAPSVLKTEAQSAAATGPTTAATTAPTDTSALAADIAAAQALVASGSLLSPMACELLGGSSLQPFSPLGGDLGAFGSVFSPMATDFATGEFGSLLGAELAGSELQRVAAVSATLQAMLQGSGNSAPAAVKVEAEEGERAGVGAQGAAALLERADSSSQRPAGPTPAPSRMVNQSELSPGAAALLAGTTATTTAGVTNTASPGGLEGEDGGSGGPRRLVAAHRLRVPCSTTTAGLPGLPPLSGSPHACGVHALVTPVRTRRGGSHAGLKRGAPGDTEALPQPSSPGLDALARVAALETGAAPLQPAPYSPSKRQALGAGAQALRASGAGLDNGVGRSSCSAAVPPITIPPASTAPDSLPLITPVLPTAQQGGSQQEQQQGPGVQQAATIASQPATRSPLDVLKAEALSYMTRRATQLPPALPPLMNGRALPAISTGRGPRSNLPPPALPPMSGHAAALSTAAAAGPQFPTHNLPQAAGSTGGSGVSLQQRPEQMQARAGDANGQQGAVNVRPAAASVAPLPSSPRHRFPAAGPSSGGLLEQLLGSTGGDGSGPMDLDTLGTFTLMSPTFSAGGSGFDLQALLSSPLAMQVGTPAAQRLLSGAGGSSGLFAPGSPSCWGLPPTPGTLQVGGPDGAGAAAAR